MTGFKVYEAIAAVTAGMAKEGISKGRHNQQQGYAFRGIDDVYNALSGMLAANKLCILPRVLDRECIERKTQKGTPLFYTVLIVEFDFVSAEDGSKHTVRMIGEAMDSADKSSNKAMSAAYKYAAMQTFCIPTEGDNDADFTTHDVQHEPEPVYIEKSSAHLKKTGSWEKLTEELEQDMLDVRSLVALEKVKVIYRKRATEEGWNKSFKDALKITFDWYEERIKAENPGDAVDDIMDTFPGSKVVAEHIRNHPINAG